MKDNTQNITTDVLVIGTGAAGLGAALSLPNDTNIILVSKDELHTGASPRAQGGISAAMTNEDLSSHIQDTLVAGAGLCETHAVEFTVNHAKEAIEWLIQEGVEFTKMHNNALHLTQEGGHSHRRVVHTADRTGDAVVRSLTDQVNAKANITCLTQHTAIDLLTKENTCFGAIFLDNASNECISIVAKKIILATGGASSAYLHKSNPDACTGDGIAMAWRAGCAISNMEFTQFHPTCLFHPTANNFLISEAVRGEGGSLKLPNGQRFMPAYHQSAELAPRDIVTRAIDTEMKKNQLDHVLLDTTHLSADQIATHFPTIKARCLSLGIDMTQQGIPVVPAAHYTCGGIKTNLLGQTDIANLYAVGEVAYTGLHGANRMASNSLLECVVFAASCAKDIQSTLKETKTTTTQLISSNENTTIADKKILEALTQSIQKIMWEKVGIIRNNKTMQEAKKELSAIHDNIDILWKSNMMTRELIEVRNLSETANIIVDSALNRKESRGLHFNSDYPDQMLTPIITTLQKTNQDQPS